MRSRLFRSVTCIALRPVGGVLMALTVGGSAPAVIVIDGDTIRLEGETVRVANIDAPEMRRGAECWAEAALAIQARRWVVARMAGARSITLSRQGRDRWGRTLATVRVDGVDLGEDLVSAGLASRWTGKRWDWCAREGEFSAPGGPFLGSPGSGGPRKGASPLTGR